MHVVRDGFDIVSPTSYWSFQWWEWDVFEWGFAMPTWAASLIVGVPAGMLCLWDRRRHKPGICVKCGYDLVGLPTGAACPECGRGAA